KPRSAPKKGAQVELDFFFAKRVKSLAAVTHAKLKAAKTSTAAPALILAEDGGRQAIISDSDTCWKTMIVSQMTKTKTKMIPKRSIICTERSPIDVLNKCKTLITRIPRIKPLAPPGLP